jgi:hypothetical protein
MLSRRLKTALAECVTARCDQRAMLGADTLARLAPRATDRDWIAAAKLLHVAPQALSTANLIANTRPDLAQRIREGRLPLKLARALHHRNRGINR